MIIKVYVNICLFMLYTNKSIYLISFFITIILFLILNFCFFGEAKNPIENIEFKTLIGIFTNIAEILAITPEGCKVAEYLNNKLDKIYNLFLTNNKTKINKIVTG